MSYKSGTKMYGFILIVGFGCCGLFLIWGVLVWFFCWWVFEDFGGREFVCMCFGFGFFWFFFCFSETLVCSKNLPPSTWLTLG